MLSNAELPELLTYQQVAEVLRVSKTTVNRYTKRSWNPLPVVYLNPETMKSPRIRKADLQVWVETLEDPRRDV